jgi:DNA-binding transcriptional ArsR family regulator
VAISVNDERAQRSEPIADGAIAAGALDHPIRWFLIALLGDRPMTAAELAQAAEMKPSAVRRHLREMRAAGTIEVVEVRSRRNAAEQVYRTCTDFIFTQAQRAEQSPDERRRFDAYILKVAIGEALRSLVSSEARRSRGRADECVTRVPMILDDEGWAELASAHEDFVLRTIELRGHAEERLKEKDAKSIRATSFVLFFEVSPLP